MKRRTDDSSVAGGSGRRNTVRSAPTTLQPGYDLRNVANRILLVCHHLVVASVLCAACGARTASRRDNDGTTPTPPEGSEARETDATPVDQVSAEGNDPADRGSTGPANDALPSPPTGPAPAMGDSSPTTNTPSSVMGGAAAPSASNVGPPQPSGPDPTPVIDDQLGLDLPFVEDCDDVSLWTSETGCRLAATCGDQYSFTDCYFGEDEPAHCDCRSGDVVQRLEAPDVDEKTFCTSAMEYCVSAPVDQSDQQLPTCTLEPFLPEDPTEQDLRCISYEVCGYDLELPGGVAARAVTRRQADCVVRDTSLRCSCGQIEEDPPTFANFSFAGDEALDLPQLCEDLVVDYCVDWDLEPTGATQCAYEASSATSCNFQLTCRQDVKVGAQDAEMLYHALGSCTPSPDATASELWDCSCPPDASMTRLEGSIAEACERGAALCADELSSYPNLSHFPDIRVLRPR